MITLDYARLRSQEYCFGTAQELRDVGTVYGGVSLLHFRVMQADSYTRNHPRAAQFRTTRWSLVLRAGEEQLSPADERRALEELCRAYWYPLFSFIRRRVYDPTTAADLTQGFFLQLLERNSFTVADQQRGRFRTFLLAALEHYLANERASANSLKRGGGVEIVSLDLTVAEGRFATEPSVEETPERAFDRRWVEVLLGNVLAKLRAEEVAAGERERFDQLKGYLLEGDQGMTFAVAAEKLGMTEASLKGQVRRLRARFRKALREEVAQTVASQSDVESELRHLMEAV